MGVTGRRRFSKVFSIVVLYLANINVLSGSVTWGGGNGNRGVLESDEREFKMLPLLPFHDFEAPGLTGVRDFFFYARGCV
jgi:hypothetical protein